MEILYIVIGVGYLMYKIAKWGLPVNAEQWILVIMLGIPVGLFVICAWPIVMFYSWQMKKDDADSEPRVYVPVQTNKCVWCHDSFKEGERKPIDYGLYGIQQVALGDPVEYFMICDYCREGMACVQDEWVLHAMLTEAKRTPDRKRGRGFNDFICAANKILESKSV